MKVDLKDVTTWIPREIFEAYCGTKTERLLQFYDKAVEKKNMVAWDFNLLGFLLLPAWLGYRKQWSFLATITLIMAFLPFIEALFDFSLPAGGFVGIFIVFGFLCNGFLLSTAHSEFIKLKKQGLDDTQITKALQNKASASIPMAIVSGVAYIAIIVGSTFLADVLFGLPV